MMFYLISKKLWLAKWQEYKIRVSEDTWPLGVGGIYYALFGAKNQAMVVLISKLLKLKSAKKKHCLTRPKTIIKVNRCFAQAEQNYRFT